MMLLLLPAVVGGCDTLSLKHMMGEGARRWEHPWHSVPFKLVGFVAIVGVGVVMLPAMCVEWGITGEFPMGAHEPGVTVLPVKYSAEVVGYAAALPFYVVGLPLEFLDRKEADRLSPVAPPTHEAKSAEREGAPSGGK
jgi:hypothetical protein